MSVRTSRAKFRFLIVGAVGLTCTAALAIALTIWWLRTEAINDANRDAGNLTLVLAEQINSSIGRIDFTINEVLEQIEALGARTQNDFDRLLQGENTYHWLKARMASLSQIGSIALTNKDGRLVNSTNKWPLPPTNLSDREHFLHVKNNDDQSIYVSNSLTDRVAGTRTVFFAKRINDANNKFLGMISIGVRLSYFQQIYGSIESLHNMSFLFLRKDGTILLRHPDREGYIDAKMPTGSAWYGMVSQGGGFYRSAGPFDGEARYVTARPLRDYPFVVNVAVLETAALATWRIQALTIGLGTLLTIVCLALLLKALTKQYRWLETSKAALVEKSQELDHANKKVDAALSNMSQGLAMFDPTGRLVICNDRYRQMYNLPSDLAKLGCALHDLLKHRVSMGTFFGDPEEYIDHLRATVAHGETTKTEMQIGDGRVISVVNQPMLDGGWVATHEDVTKRVRAEKASEQQKLNLNAALENISQGLCLFDGAQRLVVCNDRFIQMYGLSSEVVKPGLTLIELIKHRKETGSFPDDPNEYCAHILDQVAKRQLLIKLVDTADGRIIHMINQPIADGGWVSTHEDVTEKVRAQQLIERQKLQLDAAVENMSQGLSLFDEKQRLIVCNKRYAEIYGLSDEQTKPGTTVREILQHRIVRGTGPDDHESYINDRIKKISENKPHQFTNKLTDGRYVSVVFRPLADGGWVATHEDITEEKRREESFQLLFERNPVPMWVLDWESLRFLAINDAAVTHYGYSREQLMSMTVLDLRPAEDRERFIQSLRAESNDRLVKNALRHVKADGTIIDVCVYSRGLLYAGQKARLVAIHDITDAKKAEDIVRRTQQFLDTVIDNMPLPITVKNAQDLRFNFVNRACAEWFGVSRDKLIGKCASDLLPKQEADAMNALDNAVLLSDKSLFTDTYTMHSPDRGTRLVTTTKVAIRDDSGKPEHLLTVLDDVTERKRAEQNIVHLAHYDSLTDLPNRVTFKDTMDATIDRAKASGEKFAVLSIDLDRFKEANDTYGHMVGDALLREVARRLHAVAGGAFLARVGGDEFVLILADGAQPATASELADRLLATFIDDFEVEGQRLKLGMSIGVAIYPTDGADAKTLIVNADAALYRAKAEFRGSALFYEPEIGDRLRERHVMQEDLRSAIDRGELLLHYQPQMKMSGETIGFEALARWQCPKRGMVPPGTFIPIAEESGLIVTIGEWVLREACREAASWPQPLSIAVNISPIQFRQGDLPRLVHSILLETGLAPSRLELEVTESVMVHDFSRAVSILNRLKSLGVRIAMDDFGTGYSSLSYLQSFRCDKIKIDRIFICDLESNHHSRAIVRAVIGLGQSLNLPILAEGVETEAQHAHLVQEGCDEVQGYLTGRPLPISDYAGLVGRQVMAQNNCAIAG